MRPDPEASREAVRRGDRKHGPGLTGYLASVCAIVVVTAVGRGAFAGNSQLANVVMAYLLAIVLVSLRWGLGPSLLASLFAVIGLDLFFIPPFNTLVVTDVTHIPTFGVMLLVAVIISGLTKRVRDQAEAAHERELRTASLYSLSDALSRAETTEAVVAAGTTHVRDVFAATARVLLGDGAKLVDAHGSDDDDRRIAEWTFASGRAAGCGTDVQPSSHAMYLPLEAPGARVGVLALRLPSSQSIDHARRQHLEAFARQIAGALERTRLADQAHLAQLRIEREQLRNSLLSSVSHDLRTPLAVITGAASTLLDAKLAPPMRTELTSTILTEAERLNRLVRNLLDMTRLEAGAVEVKKEWQPVEEAVGAALERVESIVGNRPIVTDLPDSLPLVPFDSILLQQVLVNLLENAAKYTPDRAEIKVSARLEQVDSRSEVEISVADRGPGLAAEDREKIFAKFYRAEKGRGGGVGLGLTICKGIVTAHGGRIWASQRPGGGAEFHFTLPIDGSPPAIVEVAS